MTIQNGIGITSYQRVQDQRIAGSPATTRLPLCQTRRNPINQQVIEVVVGGTVTAGLYRIAIAEPDGTIHNVDFTRVAETSDGVSDGLLAAADALATLAGVCTQVDSDTNDLQFTFLHAGDDHTLTLTAPAPGTLAQAEITDPAGVAVPLARFVADGGVAAVGGHRALALPSAVAAAAIVGVALRPLGTHANAEALGTAATDDIPAGSLADVAFDGAINMQNVGADASQGDAVRVVVNTGSGDALGEARGGLSGVAGVWTCTPVAVNDGHYGIEVTVDGVVVASEIFLADASATATEIVTGLTAALGTIANVTLSGTATLILTGDEGVDLQVNDLGPQDMGVVETTPAVVHAVLMPARECYWLEDVAADAIGPIMMRL